MTSADNRERDRRICELYEAGWSAIEIGCETGLSRSQVHRIVAAGWPDEAEAEPEDDAEDGGAEDDDDTADRAERPVLVEPVAYCGEPVAYCGEEWQILPRGHGEELKRVRVARWTDARGQLCNELTFYRHRQRLSQAAIESGVDDYDRERREFDARLDAARVEYEQRSRALRSRA